MPQPECPLAGGARPPAAALTSQPGPTGIVAQQCRTWLDWAATQVDVSLANDATAGGHLLASLDALMGLARQRSGGSSDEVLGRKMSAVIVAVQEHDRVIQGLTHVAQSLRALHRHLGDAQCAESSESWHLLRQQQMQTFSMAEERVLFARIVGGDGAAGEEPNLDDTVELFAPHHGSTEP